MFRSERRREFFERRSVRYGLAVIFFAAALLAVPVLWDIHHRRALHRDVPLLATIVVVLALAGASLFLLLRAYARTSDRLTYVKLYAFDILQSLTIGVITTDLDGRVTNINERARTLAGIGPDADRLSYRDALKPVPALMAPIDRLLSGGQEFSGLDVDAPLNGRAQTLRLDGRFLISDAGERIGTILQLQDVSQLKLIDQEMARTERLAAIGTLAAGIAHEIKNPLAGLSINAQLLEEAVQSGPKTPKSDKYLGVIQSEIRRLQGIVDNYVQFARPRTVERIPAALEGIVDSILALVEPECRKRKIAVVREGFNPEPARILLDEGQVQQAILNIVINAIQAMESGGTLACRLGRAGSFATVQVADTGPGIPPEIRDRVFDLYYTTRRGGTGLGLYLAQRIVAEHKGYIDLKTGPGGTTFTVAIPAEAAS